MWKLTPSRVKGGPVSGTRGLAVSAVLCGIALALSLVDTAVSSVIPFLPGLKLGLANIVSLYALRALGPRYALAIVALRCLLAALLSGNMTMLAFSLAGGACSLAVMFALARFLSVVKVSVTGALAHNLAQLGVTALYASTPQLGYYLPVLVGMGAASGFAMGVICGLLLRYTEKARFL
jgi:heptaprenyl diphosphate synthase